MKASVWVRVLGLLLAFWILVHGPNLPGTLPSRELELEQTLAGVTLGGGLLVLVTLLGCLLTPGVGRPLRLWGGQGRIYLYTLCAVLGTSFAIEGLFAFLGVSREGELGNLYRLFAGLDVHERWLAAGLLGLGPGFAEELCFRGWVLSRISAVSGQAAGIAVSALAFGLFHFDPLYAALTSVLGLVLGLAVTRSGVLGPAMLAHALNNAVSVLGAGLEHHSGPWVHAGLMMTAFGAALWGCIKLWFLKLDAS